MEFFFGLSHLITGFGIFPYIQTHKVEKIKEDSLDSIPSPSTSVKIKLLAGKITLGKKAKHCNVLPLHLKQTFLPTWIFTEGEGDGIKSRLPFKIFSTLSICSFHLIGKVCQMLSFESKLLFFFIIINLISLYFWLTCFFLFSSWH